MQLKDKALASIKASAGTEAGQYGIDEFVQHHLEELPTSYWQAQLGTANPTHTQVMDLLVLREKWEDEKVYDFALPDEVTDYVVSVSFNDDGEVTDIVMES